VGKRGISEGVRREMDNADIHFADIAKFATNPIGGVNDE
jgi:hypothetical protein